MIPGKRYILHCVIKIWVVTLCLPNVIQGHNSLQHVAVDEEEQVVDDVNDAVRDGDVWPDHARVDAVVADVN